MKEIKRENVRPGDELPCHEENILHTQHDSDGFRLKIWYVENKTEQLNTYSLFSPREGVDSL